MSILALILVGADLDREASRHVEVLRTAGTVVRRMRSHGAGLARAFDGLWRRDGIRTAEVLVIDGCGSCRVPEGARRVVPAEAAASLVEVRTLIGGLPTMPPEAEWRIEVLDADPATEHMHDTWLVMSDGLVGTLGSPLVAYPPARREVRVGGVWTGKGPDSDLVRVPDWTRLAGDLRPGEGLRRVLDLRTGFLHHDGSSTLGPFRAVTFASRTRPGLGVMRAHGDGARAPRTGPLAPMPGASLLVGRHDRGRRSVSGEVEGEAGGASVAASERVRGRGTARRLDRLAACSTGSRRASRGSAALSLLRRAERAGIDALMASQRASWARRWEEMGIRIDGDPDLQRALNFALFHLDASIARQAEAPLGPRGLSGPAYRGHVFWDSEVFVLPFFAATRPSAARAMLEYRVRRLGSAREAAREAGLHGAWFPWESAADGRDVTPPWVPGPDARPVRVWTGERELHLVADVAWAASTYAEWCGDEAFAAGDGQRLLTETARFWASRVERDADGSAHLRGVIGPDEYHEAVDDNAYTNVMARWNLHEAAAWVRRARDRARPGREADGDLPEPAEVAGWLELADRIADGYDPGTRIYEQFRGFHALEPVRIAELSARPVAGDALLGRERVARSQVIKQTDVLLLHHLVPGEVAPDSLLPNLEYYEPRTAHGSSLSPGTHATLLARAGLIERALEALRMTAFFDLDDRNGTASEGLHIPTMGALWQALAMGFAGIRPSGDALTVDPRLAPGWHLLEVPLRFHGLRVRVAIRPGRLTVRSGGPLTVDIPGAGRLLVQPRVELVQRDGGWAVRG